MHENRKLVLEGDNCGTHTNAIWDFEDMLWLFVLMMLYIGLEVSILTIFLVLGMLVDLLAISSQAIPLPIQYISCTPQESARRRPQYATIFNYKLRQTLVEG